MINEEDAVIPIALHRQKLEDLQMDIVRSLYAQAAVYEAKKNRAQYGDFAWDYYDQAQGHCLKSAKYIEHMDIERYMEW